MIDNIIVDNIDLIMYFVKMMKILVCKIKLQQSYFTFMKAQTKTSVIYSRTRGRLFRYADLNKRYPKLAFETFTSRFLFLSELLLFIVSI